MCTRACQLARFPLPQLASYAVFAFAFACVRARAHNRCYAASATVGALQVLESLNDLVMCGFADNMTPQEQTKVLGKMHYRCHNWVEERLDRFELSELAGKVSPSDRVRRVRPHLCHRLCVCGTF